MTATEQLSVLNSALAGRYAIDREIGRGGMATVYLARDVRHGRNVALKLLLPELGAILGPDRFLSEIRVTANLQHPHLLPLFDSGEAGGHLFYVMPYVGGESLRRRLERERQLPVEEAIRIAADVASALDYAHRHGVIHRDLKPENILLHDGQPVVADFGIALAVSNAGGARITQTGISLGTPQYMSPEQAAGDRQLDARTDIYSLGCVLYEMLAGDPPHTASTVQAVIAKVLTEEPRSVRALRRSVPEHVEAALERALTKIPADRWPTAVQFADALTHAGRVELPPVVITSATAQPPPALAHGVLRWARVRSSLPRGLALVVAVLVGVSLGAWGWGKLRSMQTVDAHPVRFTLALSQRDRFVESSTTIVFSRDGRHIAYRGRGGPEQSPMLYVRSLEQLRPRPIPGTEAAWSPAFSPDGRWLAFATFGGGLGKVLLSGGTVVTLAEGIRGGVGGLDWGVDDMIVYGSAQGLFRVPATGGKSVRLTSVDSVRGEVAHNFPRFLPGGKSAVFVVEARGSSELDHLGIASLNGKGYTALDIPAVNLVGFLDGNLLFGRADGTVAAASLDTRRDRVKEEWVPVLDGVAFNPDGWALASVSDNGSLAYMRGNSSNRLAIVDERGGAAGGIDEPRRYAHPRFSPDGRRIALGIGSSSTRTSSDIWVYDLNSGVLSRLTSRASSIRPEWTPDGRSIAYIADAGGRSEAWLVPADGSGPETRLDANLNNIREITFSPDGSSAVIRTSGGPTQRDLWLLPLSGDTAARKAKPLLQTPFSEAMPRVSPDGRWLAYISDETGQFEVYLRPFPGPGGRVQVSAGGGTEPVWSPDGGGIFYRVGDRFMAASLSMSRGVSVTGRKILFEGLFASGTNNVSRAEYDVHPDGKRFVALRLTPGETEIVVVLNWLAELRERTAESGKR